MNDGGQSFDDLTAADGAAWIGVHVLTEFLFCRRAGLITFEQQRTDTGEEWDDGPRLDFLPDFSFDLIERVLQATWNDIWKKLTWTPPILLLVFIASLLIHWGILLSLIPMALWLGVWLLGKLGNVFELSRRLQIAREAIPQEPAADSAEMQPVNWWGLLKSGFQPQQYEGAHEVSAWQLCGHPWRVLVKGSLRIPVFRKRRGKPEIYPQHKARMTAYCRLLEESEGGQSPYGVVLFGYGYDGVAIPNTGEHRQLLAEGLRDTRQLLMDVTTAGLMPDIPRPANVCHNCPLGRPHSYRPGESETVLNGVQLPAYRTRGEDRRQYHSICGDRFRWVPPHDRAGEKRLC